MSGVPPEETAVITRMWRGWARSTEADRYEPNYESAVVAGEARKVLVRFDARVCHYETAFEA